MSLFTVAFILTSAFLGIHVQGRGIPLTYEIAENPEINGDLYQGDIILTQDQISSLYQRKAQPYGWWPADSDGKVVVPFVLNPNETNRAMRSLTRTAMSMWENATCISFEEHPSLPETRAHLYFDMRDSGCYSYLGRTGRLQRVNIGRYCGMITAAHEVAHALGFKHEQARSDRDQFVDIIESNIILNKERNFEKFGNTINYVEYDYASIMHYSGTGFTKNGLPTIRTTDPLYQNLIGQRGNLTFRDIKTMNLHYKCADAFKCGEDTCQNEGYLGKRCVCVCPPGTSGDMCQIKNDDYTGAIMKQLLPNNGRVTSPGPFTSPGYPVFPFKWPGFIQVVESKDNCEEVEVTVDEFNLPTCSYSKLYITETGNTTGIEPLCGYSSPKLVVRAPKVVFTYVSYTSWHPTVKGYKGTVKFVRNADCSPAVSPETTSTFSTMRDIPSEEADNQHFHEIKFST